MPDDNRHLIARNETIGTHHRKLHDAVKPRMARNESLRGNVQLVGVALVEVGDENQLRAGIL